MNKTKYSLNTFSVEQRRAQLPKGQKQLKTMRKNIKAKTSPEKE